MSIPSTIPASPSYGERPDPALAIPGVEGLTPERLDALRTERKADQQRAASRIAGAADFARRQALDKMPYPQIERFAELDAKGQAALVGEEPVPGFRFETTSEVRAFCHALKPFMSAAYSDPPSSSGRGPSSANGWMTTGLAPDRVPKNWKMGDPIPES